MDRKELLVLEKEQLVDIIFALVEQVKKLTARVEELEAKLNTNSGNSSKPPSQDGYGKPAPKSLREPSGKKPGGQKGHEGNGLRLEREPDETIEHNAEVCQKCGTSLRDADCVCVATSNVIDFEIEVKIVSHKQMETVCPNCGSKNKGEMPKEASHSMVYGAGLRAFVVMLTNYVCVGMKKISNILADVFGICISTGTIKNINSSFAQNSGPILREIKERAVSSPIINADESGMNVNGANWWVHNASTPELTYMTAHQKRGVDGIDDNGVLSDYVGVVVHDFWSPYFKYTDCAHAMCCAHLLRELNWVHENTDYTWAAEMRTLLCKMKIVKEDYLQAEKLELSRYYVTKFAREYAEIVALGELESPRIKGQTKQSKSRNLLERFIGYKDEITLFAHDFNVPFDNNQAERDIRNAKVKQKVSGLFRSESGIKNFAGTSSVIGTAKKQGLSVFKTLKDIVTGKISSLFFNNSTATE